MYRTVWTSLTLACLLGSVLSASAQEREKQVQERKAREEKAEEAKARDEKAKAIELDRIKRQIELMEIKKQREMAAMAQARSASTTAVPKTEPQDAGRDEALLRSVGVSTDGPGLLTFLHLRGRGEAKPDRLAALIEQLGDKSPTVAQKASGELAAIGAPAIPMLRQAVKDPDRQQIMQRARRCLQALEEHPGRLSAAATRLLGQRRPPGTAAALLAFLPAAEDEGVVEEIRLALLAAAYADGKPDPALLQALSDETPIRRALAIDTLCHNGINASLLEQVPLHKLLQDAKPSVRLRAALALARAPMPAPCPRSSLY